MRKIKNKNETRRICSVIESTGIRKENVGGFSGVTAIAEKTKENGSRWLENVKNNKEII